MADNSGVCVYGCVYVFVCRNPDESSSSQRTRCVGCPVGIHNTSKTCAQDVQVRERDAEIERAREGEQAAAVKSKQKAANQVENVNKRCAPKSPTIF